jgi:hypothetical protein
VSPPKLNISFALQSLIAVAVLVLRWRKRKNRTTANQESSSIFYDGTQPVKRVPKEENYNDAFQPQNNLYKRFSQTSVTLNSMMSESALYEEPLDDVLETMNTHYEPKYELASGSESFVSSSLPPRNTHVVSEIPMESGNRSFRLTSPSHPGSVHRPSREIMLDLLTPPPVNTLEKVRLRSHAFSDPTTSGRCDDLPLSSQRAFLFSGRADFEVSES